MSTKIKTTDSVVMNVTKDELEDRAQRDLETLEHYRKSHNKRHLTRRDFLATGVIPFLGTMMLGPLARAQSIVCSTGSGEWIPLITINLTGGSGLSSHWLPLDAGNQLLPSYSKMGWGKAGAFAVDYEFANRAPFFQGSTLLAGIRNQATPAALAVSSFVGVAVRSQDDSSMNAFDFTGLARGIGLNGKLIGNLGTSNTATGNGTQPAYMAPPAPLVVGSYDDITGALGVSGGSLTSIVTGGRAGALFSMIQQLSGHQAKPKAKLNGGEVLQSSIVCRTQDNTALVSSASGASVTDPRSNGAFSTIWGIANNTSVNSRAFVFGSMVYNSLMGNAGSVNLTMGGYDYHNGTRTSGDARDNDAGLVIGRVIQSCMLLNKKAFIAVVSDGSVTSAESDSPGSPWASDGGIRGAAYMIAVNPTGALASAGTQLGSFIAAQAADDKSVVGNSPERAAAAMFMNYLNVNKKLGELDKVLPRIFSAVDIQKMTVLG